MKEDCIMIEYSRLAQHRIQQIAESQGENIHAAGMLLAEMIEEDRLIYVFGAGGHTSLVTGEMFFRIGGLANIYPVYEYGLTALSQARKFIALERCHGLGGSLIQASGIGVGDVLLLFHTIGVNATCIEAAKVAREMGAKVIGIASSKWQDETPADAEIRGAGSENLRDLVDIYIDDCNTVEDAAVSIEGIDIAVGPLSGIGTFAIAHMIEAVTVRECVKRGIAPPVWDNANTPVGAAKNRLLMEKYAARIPML